MEEGGNPTHLKAQTNRKGGRLQGETQKKTHSEHRNPHSDVGMLFSSINLHGILSFVLVFCHRVASTRLSAHASALAHARRSSSFDGERHQTPMASRRDLGTPPESDLVRGRTESRASRPYVEVVDLV